jgi:hypothetical protein
MRWKNRELVTAEDIMRFGIDRCDNPKEARLFMEEYSKETPSAPADIGYISGYYSYADRQRICEWFGVEHPLFGGRNLEPKQLFATGYEMGRIAKETGQEIGNSMKERTDNCPPYLEVIELAHRHTKDQKPLILKDDEFTLPSQEAVWKHLTEDKCPGCLSWYENASNVYKYPDDEFDPANMDLEEKEFDEEQDGEYETDQ